MKILPWLLIASCLIPAVYLAVNWNRFEATSHTQETTNSFIRQDSFALTAKVNGYVKSVLFHDFERVKAGQVLIELVDDDYRAALNSAEAKLLKSQSQLKNLDNEVGQQLAVIRQIKAEASQLRAKLNQANADYQRFRMLVEEGAVTRQDTDNARFTAEQAKANYESGVANIDVQDKQLLVLQGERDQREADVKSAQADVNTAALELSYTRIVAPSDGVVGERSVQPGDLLSSGTSAANFVANSTPYVISNYKETQLANIRVGQRVSISVDSFPGQAFSGRVAMISPATGSTFAAVPADNATGNFTKVTQRIPVRIEFDASQPTELLRAGMSTTTEIDTVGVL